MRTGHAQNLAQASSAPGLCPEDPKTPTVTKGDNGGMNEVYDQVAPLAITEVLLRGSWLDAGCCDCVLTESLGTRSSEAIVQGVKFALELHFN